MSRPADDPGHPPLTGRALLASYDRILALKAGLSPG